MINKLEMTKRRRITLICIGLFLLYQGGLPLYSFLRPVHVETAPAGFIEIPPWFIHYVQALAVINLVSGLALIFGPSWCIQFVALGQLLETPMFQYREWHGMVAYEYGVNFVPLVLFIWLVFLCPSPYTKRREEEA